MKLLNTTKSLSKTRDGRYFSNIFSNKWEEIPSNEWDGIDKIYCIMKVAAINDATKKEYISNVCKKYGYTDLLNELNNVKPLVENITSEEGKTIAKAYDALAIKDNIDKLISFFSEFEFEPNFRFVNTFVRTLTRNIKAGKEYIANYFALTDSPYAMAIAEKMKSAEFTQICENFKTLDIEKKINNRFKLYYGSQGTGKTTKAIEEADGNCMVCHSAMLPSDLMEDFKFEDGKATFIPSALQNAMTNGNIIVLDEINLLPFESLRFLQSVLDGKKQFEYKGKTVEIKDGFKIIGTMNLNVNGSVYSLPEPLVDRAEEIKCYKLTAENLVGALI